MKSRVILSLIITLALVLSAGIYVKADPDDNPGQIVDNPFEGLFTSSQPAETTSSGIGDIVTNPWGDELHDDTQLPTLESYSPPGTRETSTEVTTVAPTQETASVAPSQEPTKQPASVETSKLPNPIPAIKVPGKTKVKKATKKKSAKKIKIKIKKIKGAKGYQVAIYKSKKKAKRNKKALVKKFTKKVKVKIKSKRLKNKKKLFIRVRAYTLDGNKKVYGPWSKVKKAKIKK